MSGPTGNALSRTRSARDPPASPPVRQLLARQRIHFCTAADGVRIAYASVGAGPPLVKAANWLSHLELDWDAPIWSPLFRELARDHLFVRYDERGNGLSDWDVDEISFDVFVTDLETVSTSSSSSGSRCSGSRRAAPSRSSMRCVTPSACRI